MIRSALEEDLPDLLAIYNHYVRETPITFDLEEVSFDARRTWFKQFATEGRHQLLVAEENGRILGYAHSTAFRPKPAYQRSVETTVYLLAAHQGAGRGSALLRELLKRLRDAQTHRAYAIITLPNDASIRLHEKLGYQPLMALSEVGHKFGRYWDTQWMECRL
ncbi:MAG: N-acetyltransferase family protein [Pseudomonadota bacterium]